MPNPRRLLWDILPRNTPNSQNLLLRCPPTDFSLGGYGRDAIPSYICAHPCHLWEALLCKRFCEFRAFCGNIFSPTDFTDLHRYLGCAVLPQNSQNTQNLAAWVWQECHTLLHLWEALLCKRFCVFGVFRGSFFTACSVGAAETAAPPGGIHRNSVQISPFHLKPSLLHVLPVLWVRLRNHLRLVYAQPGEHDGSRCERHRHAVVVVGVDRL